MNIDVTLEEALQRASKPLRRKIEYSFELLRKAEKLALTYDKREGYFLAFSGGKDSQALFHVAQLAGVKFTAHMNLTSIDPPEVIRFVKKHYPEVELTKPKDSIYNIALRRQILPTSRKRWCCKEFKETAGAGRVTLIGIRHEESSRRARRNEVEISSRKFSGTLDGLDEYRQAQREKRLRRRSQREDGSTNITNATEEQTAGCIHGKELLLVSPIIRWTVRDVWEFLNQVVCVPHCELYDEGWHRLGCINCPMASAKQKSIENKRWPHVKRNWIKAIMKIRAGGDLSEQTYAPPLLRRGGEDRNPIRRYVWCNIYATMQPTRQTNSGRLLSKERVSRQGRQSLSPTSGFSACSSADGLHDEQTELEIAENIYDWWISGKSYKRWYAEKFMQQKINF